MFENPGGPWLPPAANAHAYKYVTERSLTNLSHTLA